MQDVAFPDNNDISRDRIASVVDHREVSHIGIMGTIEMQVREYKCGIGRIRINPNQWMLEERVGSNLIIGYLKKI